MAVSGWRLGTQSELLASDPFSPPLSPLRSPQLSPPCVWVSPCPRVTVPTCPLLTLRLRLCFRFMDQREDADRHDDEAGIADPLGQAEEFGEAEFAVGADGQDVRGHPIEGQGVGDAAEDHPGEARQGVQSSGGDGGESRAGAIAEEHHADAEDGGAETDGQEVGRFDVILGEVLAMKDRDTDAADGDGGHHDLEHGEVAELEEAHDDVEVGHAAAMQQEAEDESEADGGPEEFGAGEESERESHGFRSRLWVRLGGSGRRAASR